MSFDPKTVYYVRTMVGGKEIGTDIATDVHVFDSTEPDEDQRICFWAMRSGGPVQAAYPTHMVVEEGEKVIAYRTDLTKAHRIPVKVHYEPLTHENFARLEPHISGYDLIKKEAPTDAALRGWYREAIFP